jgi:hypothetical protein
MKNYHSFLRNYRNSSINQRFPIFVLINCRVIWIGFSFGDMGGPFQPYGSNMWIQKSWQGQVEFWSFGVNCLRIWFWGLLQNRCWPPASHCPDEVGTVLQCNSPSKNQVLWTNHPAAMKPHLVEQHFRSEFLRNARLPFNVRQWWQHLAPPVRRCGHGMAEWDASFQLSVSWHEDETCAKRKFWTTKVALPSVLMWQPADSIGFKSNNSSNMWNELKWSKHAVCFQFWIILHPPIGESHAGMTWVGVIPRLPVSKPD